LLNDERYLNVVRSYFDNMAQANPAESAP